MIINLIICLINLTYFSNLIFIRVFLNFVSLYHLFKYFLSARRIIPLFLFNFNQFFHLFKNYSISLIN